MQHNQLNAAPDLIECDAVALEAIRTTREVVNDKPRLCVVGTEQKEVSEPADRERRQRKVGRDLFQELSKYYPRAGRL